MPQPFQSAVVTNEGIKLVTKSLAGEAKIEFTKISIGDGIYSQEEMAASSLQERKDLKSCRNIYGLSNIEIFSENSVKVTALITNQNPVTEEVLIENGYFINEIGLYAKEKDGADETEILYSIAITDGEKGDFIPAYNGNNPAKIIQDFYATVGNAEEVVIRDTPDAVALEKDFIKVKNELPSLMKKTGDSKENFVTFTSEDEGNPSSWSDVAVLESEEKHSSILKKISTMFKNIRWIYKKLGTTDISTIGNGTVTGALNQVNSKLNPAGVGLGNVDNTHDSEKNVATADLVNGTYTNGGGQQPPAYIPSGKTRFNMWNAFKGLANPSGGYMDCILMDNYTGNDVPFVTGIGVTKNSGNPRMFIANGAKGGANWANQVEAITSANIGSQNVNYANSAGSATNATNATNASNDGSGRNIVSTYYIKAEVDNRIEWKKAYTDTKKPGTGGTLDWHTSMINSNEVTVICKAITNNSGENYDTSKLGTTLFINKFDRDIKHTLQLYADETSLGYVEITFQSNGYPYIMNRTKETIEFTFYYKRNMSIN